LGRRRSYNEFGWRIGRRVRGEAMVAVIFSKGKQMKMLRQGVFRKKCEW
jgi:hypothetical protein